MSDEENRETKDQSEQSKPEHEVRNDPSGAIQRPPRLPRPVTRSDHPDSSQPSTSRPASGHLSASDNPLFPVEDLSPPLQAPQDYPQLAREDSENLKHVKRAILQERLIWVDKRDAAGAEGVSAGSTADSYKGEASGMGACGGSDQAHASAMEGAGCCAEDPSRNPNSVRTGEIAFGGDRYLLVEESIEDLPSPPFSRGTDQDRKRRMVSDHGAGPDSCTPEKKRRTQHKRIRRFLKPVYESCVLEASAGAIIPEDSFPGNVQRHEGLTVYDMDLDRAQLDLLHYGLERAREGDLSVLESSNWIEVRFPDELLELFDPIYQQYGAGPDPEPEQEPEPDEGRHSHDENYYVEFIERFEADMSPQENTDEEENPDEGIVLPDFRGLDLNKDDELD